MSSDQSPFNFFATSTPLPMAPLTPPGGGGGGNSSSGGGGPGSSTGKRANRTRFTDYQIKVLQEFFENNAYPKDDDLEYLSKLLSLSPRVIVVWFQNTRQKARKVYENQPPVAGGAGDPASTSGSATPGSGTSGGGGAGTDPDGSARFQRTPGLNYQCKKCLLVFQRYYELIRHQKTHCFKEEDAKRSPVAQAAAAQAAACFSSSDNDNSNSSSLADASVMSGTASSCGAAPQLTILPKSSSSSTIIKTESNVAAPPPPPPKQPEMFQTQPAQQQQQHQQNQQSQNDSAFHCEQCGLTFSRFDLWREHQIVHIMNPDLFSGGAAAAKMATGMETQYAALLQQHQAAVVAAAAAQLSASLPAVSAGSSGQMTPPSSGSLIPSGSKRKHEVVEDDEERGGGGGGCGGSGSGGGGTDGDGQPRDKRLRTTILPEQLDFLYQQYQLESNPSRKMLETISREVGLKKRVVQVWFQNARAKEKKNKLNAQKAAGDLSAIESNVGAKQPDGCDLCDFKYSHKYAVQDHIVTHQHIERVKIHVAEQSGKHGDDMPTSVARSSKGGGHQQESQEPSTPTPVGGSSAETTTSPPNSSNATESAQLEALLLHQLYGMGYGAAGVPAAALAAAAAAAAASSSYNNSQQQSSTNVMAGGES
jgi:AT-binding transcription factor 1